MIRTVSIFAVLHCASVVAQAAPPIHFSREIRPILSQNCFFCHGPDDAVREADLRFDVEASAKGDHSGSVAIVPGKPAESLLIQRIESKDPDEVMPPTRLHKTISREQIDLLKEWIRQGAVWGKHWSYESVERPEVPRSDEPNPIDVFLAERLTKEKLAFSPPADPSTLIRRLSLDIVGLPPTQEEMEKLSQLSHPQIVQYFFDQPTYGEHWARHWLDLARYADSAGYPSDPGREIWSYRDWVIRALNGNMPFDRFTVMQLAGDLLPAPTDDHWIATAFHRNTMTNNEGGTNDEEFRVAAIIDRVNTTFAVWMGTTMACAQCHTHKYDPITNHEYFQMVDFFNQSQDADKKDESPLHSFDTAEQIEQREKLRSQLAALEEKFNTPDAKWLKGQTAWEESLPLNAEWKLLMPTAAYSDSKTELRVQTDGRVLAAAPKEATDIYQIEFPLPPFDIKAIRIDVLTDPSLPQMGPGHAGGNFVLSQVKAAIVFDDAKLEPSQETEQKRDPIQREILFSNAFADVTQVGFKAKDVIAEKSNNAKGWAIAGFTGREHALTLLAKGSESYSGPGKLLLTLSQTSKYAQHTLGAFRVSVSDDARIADLVDISPDVLLAMRSPVEERSESQSSILRDYYVRNVAHESKVERDRIAALTKELNAIKPLTVPVMKDLDEKQHRVTKVQLRGNWQALGDEVTAATPAAFNPMPRDATRNRLSMARWLVSRDNPLTARVAVNRMWESVFGIGIVRSSEEFGSQGDLPEHPELLDWLAAEFMDSGWDVKHILALLFNSRAYRQTSASTAELNDRDPDNRWLARGPRFRPSGELLRDQALAVSSLLSLKMFGPPVRPPMPFLGLKTAFGKENDWEPSKGDDGHRRSIYTEIRRNNPYPSFNTFDAPNREVCTIRRGRSNTPLQAFVTLNDPVFVEAHQAMARRIDKDGGDDFESRVRFAFRICLAREPSANDLASLKNVYVKALDVYRNDAELAKKMATEPMGPVSDATDPVELAAWTAVASVVMNLDEFLMRR